MHLLKNIAALSTLLASVSAVGVTVCYQSHFQGDCHTVTGDPGQCLYVGDEWNDHVYSARAASGTSSCTSWDNDNGGVCSGELVTGIDSAGYGGLPGGSITSAFTCS
jgi:FMN phosphatase YigB (HAD superfamily)